MKNGFLITAFLILSYSQTGSGSTLTAGLSAPTNLTQSHPQTMANDGIQIDFAHTGLPACEGWVRCGSNTAPTVTGNSKTYGALGELWLSGSGSSADRAITLRASDSGAGSDADVLLGAAAVDGLSTTSTPEPGSLLMAGSALIAIGTTLKKMRKKI